MKLLHELILFTANRDPASPALRHRLKDITYAELAAQVSSVSGGLLECGVQRGDRVAIYLPKQPEAVIAYFATSMAGAVFVPINSQLKAAQVEHILDDCAAKILITTADRAQSLRAMCAKHNGLQTVVLDGDEDSSSLAGSLRWEELLAASANQRRSDESDLAALFYTSGSTGKPKGVMLSHCNLVTGAESVSQYLQNDAGDRLLTVLPFSFDYGFSQLSTAFLVGACVVLFEYLLPRDVVRAVKNERITGLACVPTVWLQLSRQQWPVDITNHLRYITNSGGSLPQTALGALRKKLPKTDVYLMYGLTEAFRSTYLDPTEIDRRPTSIGKAVPNAKVMIVHADGSPCGANEPGELVHSGPFVALGYWNDPENTAKRFRPAPGASTTEIAVWSGDTVRADEEGFLYFVGRSDDMIKTSGYRVSPTEIEEVLYDSGLVSVAAAVGIPHHELGQAIVVAAVSPSGSGDSKGVLDYCRSQMPNYMIPAHVDWRTQLPRTVNDKIDRQLLASELKDFFAGTTA